jgi:hypothetical protein
MTTIFAVVGEHHDDPDRLLLLGTDGQYYQYQLLDETTSPVNLDESWDLDADLLPLDDFIDPSCW